MKSLDILFLLDSSLFVLETETRLFFLPSRKFSPFSLSLSLCVCPFGFPRERNSQKKKNLRPNGQKRRRTGCCCCETDQCSARSICSFSCSRLFLSNFCQRFVHMASPVNLLDTCAQRVT